MGAEIIMGSGVCQSLSKNAITAKQARSLADSSSFTIDHIYKEIKEIARMNQTKLRWCLDCHSDEALKTVTNELTNAGFAVNIIDDNTVLEITW